MKSDLKYTGKLSIKLGRKRRKLYNQGKIDLFRLFANALVGLHNNTSIPDTFVIVEGNNPDKELFRIAIQKTTLIDDGITARYSGYLATPVASNLESVKIKLVKIDNEAISLDFAELLIERDNLAILKSITNEKSALLEWDLTVDNKGGDQE